MTNPQHSAIAEQVWQNIYSETEQTLAAEPVLAPFLQATILDHSSMGQALSYHLSSKLASSAMPATMLRELMDQAFAEPAIIQAAARDIQATVIAIPPAIFLARHFYILRAFWHCRPTACPTAYGRETSAL